MMSDQDCLIIRYTLDALETVGAGLPGKVLMDQVERSSHNILTTVERQRMLQLITDRGWAYTYRQTLTDTIMYAITDAGKTARLGL